MPRGTNNGTEQAAPKSFVNEEDDDVAEALAAGSLGETGLPLREGKREFVLFSRFGEIIMGIESMLLLFPSFAIAVAADSDDDVDVGFINFDVVATIC